jgi:hypothetical protein
MLYVKRNRSFAPLLIGWATPSRRRSRALLRRLLQSYAWPSTILVDELDAGGFKASFDYVEGGVPRFMYPSFQLAHGYYPNPRFNGEFLLAPVKESPSGSTL